MTERVGMESVEDVCSTSTSTGVREVECPYEPTSQNADAEAMMKVQSALREKIQELEAAEAEEKEFAKAAKRAVRDVQKILSSKDHSTAEKLELIQQKFIDRVNDQVKSEKNAAQLQKKLDKISAERAALSEEVRRLTMVNTKLQELCRTLQAQNKTVMADAKEKAAEEATQREELSQRMETAMKEISSRLEEHSAESQKCMQENMDLRIKLEKVGEFCDEMDREHKEQVMRKETQISFLKERIQEQSDLVEHYVMTEKVLQEKCLAAEGARDTYAKQLTDAKERIDAFCDSFEKSNTAFKQLQDQVDTSQKIQKKMQQESELLKKRSDLVQQKSQRLVTENEKLLEQVDGMRGKLEQSVSMTDHNKIRAQKGALEKLCRVLQAEIKELRKRHPRSLSMSATQLAPILSENLATSHSLKQTIDESTPQLERSADDQEI